MRKFGLIGGIGPESTVVYYKLIIKRFQELTGSKAYPGFLIKNVDMTEMLNNVLNKHYDKLTDFLENKILDLEKAGVDFGAIASNTPHIIFDKLIERVSLPLISIVEETCKKAQSLGLKRLGLFGTNSTMTNDFYQKVGRKYGLKIISPSKTQREFIHDKYMNELIYKDIKKETKTSLIQIAQEMQSIEGLILGGTELSLILSQKDFENIRLLDSAIIHVDAIVHEMLKS